MNLSNEILWLVLLVTNFALIVVIHRLWGQVGLFVWIAIAAITANIQVTKTVELFGLTATLGNVVYAGTFLVTDILNERYGKEAARRAVIFGFLAIVTHTLLMNVALWFAPASSDMVHAHMEAIFGILPRISVASLAAYLVSQLHDIWAFQLWKRRFPRHLWLRNNLSTGVSQLIDSVVFTLAAFWGVFPAGVLAEIVLTTYLLKLIVAVGDTPFVYLGIRWHPRSEVDAAGSVG